MNSILWRGLERLIIDVGGIVFGVLGYLLYRHGLTTGRNNLSVKSKLGQLVLSGIGPGLFFMCLGSLVLVSALIHGGATLSGSQAETAAAASASPAPDAQQVWERVQKVTTKSFGVPDGKVIRTSSWKQDLGADDNNELSFLSAIEEEFGLTISDQEFDSCQNVGELSQLILSKLRKLHADGQPPKPNK